MTHTTSNSNKINWNTSYDWGDHSQCGYLTSESDPVFLAWDKNTGIEITESQITDNYWQKNGTILNLAILGNSLSTKKLYLEDSGTDYMGWQSGDGVFQFLGGLDVGNTLFANDINGFAWTGGTIDATDYIETPIIRNTDGDTVTIQDHLDVTGIINSNIGLNVPKVYNSAGLLKIQPDIQGDVELFGDTDVGNNENGKIVKFWRKAPEGNDYIRFYISANKTAYIHASNKLTLQAQVPFTINSVTDDIIFKVGDNAGEKKVYIKDSGGNTQFQVDSDGEAFIRTDLWMTNVTGDKISLFDDRKDGTGMYGFGVEPNTLYHKSPMNHRWYVGANADGGNSSIMELMETGLDIVGNIAVSGTVDGVDIATLNSNVTTFAEDLDTLTTIVGTNTDHISLTNNPHSVNKSDVGLNNADNTSDFNKPISIATQNALNLKAPLASPVFTGNVLIGTGMAHDNFHIIDTSPSFIMEESDAINSEKVWEFTATGGMFKLLAQSDLYTATQTVFEIDRGGTSPTTFCIPNSRVGVRTTNLSGQLTVDQPSTNGAIPVLTLDQGDIDQPFIEFSSGTVYTDKSGQNEYLKVKVGNNTRHLRLFN